MTSDRYCARINKALWLLGIILFPYYLWASGLPQIGHMILLLAAGFSITCAAKERVLVVQDKLKKILFYLLLFLFYALFVSVTWAIVESNPIRIIHPIFYIYNWFIVFGIFLFYTKEREEAVRWLAMSMLISASTTVLVYSVLGVGDQLRSIYGFNNPNQLSYFGLSSAVVISAAWHYGYIRRVWAIVGLLVSIFIISVSLSKAALLAVLLLLIPMMMHRTGWFRLFVIVPVLFAGTVWVPDVIDSVSSRMSKIGQDSDDSLDARGFDRLWVYPEYLVFGAGEGELRSRHFFLPEEHVFGGEFHSTWGSLFFGYGVIGMYFFFVWIFSIIRTIGVRASLFFLPFVAYGLAHMGFRFTFMWLALSVVVIVRLSALQREKEKSSSTCLAYTAIRTPLS